MRKLISKLNNTIGTVHPFVMLGLIMTASYILEVVK